MAKFFASLELQSPAECGKKFSEQRKFAISQLEGNLSAEGIHADIELIAEDCAGRLQIITEHNDIAAIQNAARSVKAITGVCTEEEDEGQIHLAAIVEDWPEGQNIR
ncbi:MAG TPA: hypothetical protein VI873_00600 [Candidatus Peribacteraceae bacterium]|nr:hypothetical protein [Candidatus Peribacteraceae bacterium]